MKDFNSFDWASITSAMGASSYRLDRERKVVYVSLMRNDRWMDLILSDNGGELNISEVVAYIPPGKTNPESVPFVSNKFSVGPLTLASRILFQLDGETPDYGLDLDRTIEEIAAGKPL